MNDREAYEFYKNPENLVTAGPAHRPRRAAAMNGTTSVRFSQETIEAVKSIAHEEGVITVSSWIRRLVQREIEQPRKTDLRIDGRGEPKPLGSTRALRPRTFACEHLSVAGIQSVSCGVCGPLQLAS